MTILGDCPQCQSNAYRDGICPDCSFVHPNVQEAIQEWQSAMGIQQTLKQQQQSLAEQNPNAKAAYKSLAFTDIMPDFSDVFGNAQQSKVKCPNCNQLTFNNESRKKGELSGSCENPKCQHEIAGALGFKRPQFLNLDKRWLKEVGGIKRNFLSPSDKIDELKKKIKKSSAQNGPTADEVAGAKQDDSMNAAMDPTTRFRKIQLDAAGIDAEQQMNADNSKEQQ